MDDRYVHGRRRAEGREVDISWAAIYANTSYPSLRLITCGGPFDSSTGQYLDNIVVYAHLM